jgi:rod shape determining protein RodA
VFDRRLVQNFDWVLMAVLLLLALISVVNLYSAVYPTRAAGGLSLFYRQIYWFLLGFGVLAVMVTFNYKVLERVAYPAYILSLSLLAAVLVFGRLTSGSRRWLSLGFMTFQPSELAKIVLIIVLARMVSQRDDFAEYSLRDLVKPMVIVLLPTLLILKEPDLGTSLLVSFVALSMMLFARIRLKALIGLTGAFLGSLPVLWLFLKDYQRERILTFLNPDRDPLGAGYHIRQSKIAIGSGQFFGKGYLAGTQTKLHFLPEQHTDFAFSVFAEEWGLAGSLVLLGLYVILIIWGLDIAKKSKDKFGSMMAVGITAMIFWQVVINLGMVMGLLPVVGIPLLLFSYGGSSLVTTMAMLGLLMNISIRRFLFQETDGELLR